MKYVLDNFRYFTLYSATISQETSNSQLININNTETDHKIQWRHGPKLGHCNFIVMYTAHWLLTINQEKCQYNVYPLTAWHAQIPLHMDLTDQMLDYNYWDCVPGLQQQASRCSLVWGPSRGQCGNMQPRMSHKCSRCKLRPWACWMHTWQVQKKKKKSKTLCHFPYHTHSIYI